MNICVSSAGRRVALLGCFHSAMRELGLEGRVCAVDCSRSAPAFHLADSAWQVPACDSSEFVPEIMALCQREQIALLVPTIDTELAAYAAHRRAFADIGVAVSVSAPETIAIAADKVLTHRWLVDNGFPTVRQALPGEVMARPEDWSFPVIAKPRGGSAGMGVSCVRTREALRVAMEERDDLVIQEIAPGHEYTVNVYVDASGHCRCAVPHCRLEVRAGEVSKGVTVKHYGLMDMARRIAEALPGARGALNIQCFLDEGGSEAPARVPPLAGRAAQALLAPPIRIIEINPRFGGGYPLAHAAGASFTKWLIQETAGLQLDDCRDQWQDNLAMLRYEEAVFLPGEAIGCHSRAEAIQSLAADRRR